LQSFFVEANLLGPLIARLARVPVVLGSRRNVNHWMSPVFARLQRASNRITTAIVANSEAVKDATVKVERTPAEKIIVQYNGVDVAAFANAASERARIRGEWQLKSDAVVVGTVATLRPVKGIDVFIDAARSVANHSERAYFVIIGDGPYRTQLHEQARLTGLGDRIRFAGETNQIPALLSALDVAVLPSRAEGFSNALLEYMAAGLPVVATAVGGNAEALDHTGCLIVPPADASTLADAVISLIGSADARVRIGTAARKRAREAFDIATAKERAVDLYADLLRDHCSRSQPGA
jgi:glycosyltransferase involved in cell wall biosynthesis